MSSLNCAMLIGRLGRDPEIQTFPDGGRVAHLSVATNESWLDKTTGQKVERTEWHRVVIRAPGLIDVVNSYCRKGDRLFVQGALVTRKWNDANGVERMTTEIVVRPIDGKIVLLGGQAQQAHQGAQSPQPSSAYDAPHAPTQPAYPQRSAAPRPTAPTAAELDDEIPF